MSSLTITRPAPHEAASFYQGYLTEVAGENIGQQLIEQLEHVEQQFRGVEDAAALFRYAPGKWSVKEVLGHLIDVERVFSYRLLRIARGDATPLPGFDQDAYVPAGRFDDRTMGSLLQDFRALRLSTLALVEGVPAGAWSRMGQASGTPISARALAYMLVGHVAHHLGVLRERYGISGKGGAVATAEVRSGV